MKISQLLFEDSNEQLFDSIIKGEYFQKNVVPIIDLNVNPTANYEDLMRSGVLLFHGTKGEKDRIYTQKFRTGSRDTVGFVHDMVNHYATEGRSQGQCSV